LKEVIGSSGKVVVLQSASSLKIWHGRSVNKALQRLSALDPCHHLSRLLSIKESKLFRVSEGAARLKEEDAVEEWMAKEWIWKCMRSTRAESLL
jgi:hypothetical protein